MSTTLGSECRGWFTAEALFWFAQDFELGNLFQFVVQRWLEHANVENALPATLRMQSVRR
jgi:hypothetical protein